MIELRIQLEREDGRFLPGERIIGTMAWDADERPDEIELRLFWHTEGRGDRDVGVAEAIVIEDAGLAEERRFELVAPARPYSFSGKLITLAWGLDLIAGKRSAHVTITISPAREEIVLDALPDDPKPLVRWAR